MRSRIFIVGTAVLGVLSIASLLGLVTGHDEIAEGALTLLVAATGLLALAGLVSVRAAGRRVDYMYRKSGAGQRGEMSAPPAVREDDLVGMLRLVQAQYVGRLDSALSTLELATENLAAAAAAEGDGTPAHARLTVLPRDEYAPAVAAAITAGIEVTVLTDPSEDAPGWVERQGWQGRVVLADRREP